MSAQRSRKADPAGRPPGCHRRTTTDTRGCTSDTDDDPVIRDVVVGLPSAAIQGAPI